LKKSNNDIDDLKEEEKDPSSSAPVPVPQPPVIVKIESLRNLTMSLYGKHTLHDNDD